MVECGAMWRSQTGTARVLMGRSGRCVDMGGAVGMVEKLHGAKKKYLHQFETEPYFIAPHRGDTKCLDVCG